MSTSSQLSPDSPPRVLVVDDDTMYATLLSAQLGVHGYEVSTEASVEAARAALERRPDLGAAILDANIDGDGVELARQLHAGRPGLVLVVVSGSSRPELRERGLPEAVPSVQKPISSADLVELLSAAGLPAART